MPDLPRRPWALPLVPLYAAGQAVENRLRRRPKRLRRPVISVGSLSAGGAGKTPVVLMLAQLLAERGIACDVLSRGYGRGSGAVEEVDPGGDARRFGDEPMELAQAGLRVWVGADRFEAGQQAEAAGEAYVHLLDDGFQHRQLHRALDVVLLTLRDTRDWLLPAGNLREPLRALARADVVVVRQEEVAALERWTHGRETWIVRRELRLPADTPRKAVAFCGIARPDGFFAGLRERGCELAGTVAFADHHQYRAEDADRLRQAVEQRAADGLITTAKDAVKLTAPLRERLGRLAVAELHVDALAPETVAARLTRVLADHDAVRR